MCLLISTSYLSLESSGATPAVAIALEAWIYGNLTEPSRMAIIAVRRKLESVSATGQSRLEANSAAAIAAHSVVRSPVAGERRAC